MKPLVATFTLALALVAVPAFAQGMDLSGLTPTMTFPEPTTETVTQDASGIDE